MNAPILVAGLPRSGTTWIGRVLGRTEGTAYVHEPDNHVVRPEAWLAKRGHGPYPALEPGDGADEYERLWARAFAGGPVAPLLDAAARLVHRGVARGGREWPGRDPGAPGRVRLAGALAERATGRPGARRTVVKSVFCARSVEWLDDRFHPQVVVVIRHPFGIIGSWHDLGWRTFLDEDPAAVGECAAAYGVGPPGPDARWIDRAAWHYGFLAAGLDRAVSRRPDWRVVRHEELCADPAGGFRRLCGDLGLTWTEDAERFLAASNRPGRRYSTNRLWAEQVARPSRLDPAERERVLEVLAGFRPAPAEVQPTRGRPTTPPRAPRSAAMASGAAGRAK